MAPSEEGVHIHLPNQEASEQAKEDGEERQDKPNGHEKHHPPRDSKGWDGKLRVDRRALARGTDGLSDPEEEEDEDDGPLPDLIEADEDLTADLEEDIEEIDLIQCRISRVDSLKLDRFTKLERLCLRQNLIQEPGFPENLNQTLKDLDLYDNLISHIRGLDSLLQLTSLDLSFNKIKHIKKVNHLKSLTDLYFVQNRIQTIENLEGLPLLRNLELGGNRIREIQALETLTALEELWLGKNKITQLKGLDSLSNLKILSIQANRLTSITGLENLSSLQELHISHNGLISLSGLSSNTNLHVIDISSNPITSLSGLESLANLEELWASYCQLSSFEEVTAVLGDKENLETVYFEGNPLQMRQPVLYRNKVRLALPKVKQIDASESVPRGPYMLEVLKERSLWFE
jgi:protein phosphatase 1 regulatory subunit 7